MNRHPQSRHARKRQTSSLHPSWNSATLLRYEKSRFVGANFPVFRLFSSLTRILQVPHTAEVRKLLKNPVNDATFF
jgi:hypothetical protein